MPMSIFLGLTLLLEPTPTPPEVSCRDVAALLDLTANDRTTFESVCSGTIVAEREREQLQLSLDRLLRVGDWRATLALHTLADPSTVARSHDAAHNPALEVSDPVSLDLTKKFGQCAAIGTAIGKFVQELEEDRFPKQVGLELLRSDPTCAKQFHGVERELEALITSHVVVTFVGEPGDHARALFLDPGSSRLVQTAPTLEHPQHPGLQFLVVPRGKRVLLFVEQVEHDVAWTSTRIYNRNATLARQSEVACIDAKLTVDAGVDAAIVVDGQVLGRELIERRRGTQDQQRTVINVPAGEHHVLMVVHGVSDEGEVRELSIPEAMEARLSVERKLTTTANACTAIEHDFHGLKTGQHRYGIARITVDERCEAAGLWSPRVRQHIEEYARLLEDKGVRLEQLDAWSEALAEFQLLQQGTGASDAMLDDRTRTAELAETVMRQGVDFLLFFELRCDAESDGVDVFGTSIDLRSFSLRPKSGGVAETRGLRDSRLHTAPRARVREAIDVVLGDLFGVGHVLLTSAPSGDRDASRQIRVAAEHPADAAPTVEVAVFRVSNRDICKRLASINALERDSNLEDLRAEITGAIRRSKRKSKVESKPEAKGEWVLFDDRVEELDHVDHEHLDGRMVPWNEAFNATGLPTGTYVAWIADVDAQRYDARCFEVHEQTFEYWLAVSAGTRYRGGIPKFNPRYDQVSHLRLTSGLRVHSRRYFTSGALLGFEHAVYDASSTPSWDDVGVDYAGDGSVSLDYSRNGLLIGAFAGVDMPFCLGPWVRRNASCKLFMRRLSWFVEAALMGNLGFLRVNSLPAGLSADATAFDPDLDVTLQGGIRILATPISRFGIILGSHWTDVTAVAANSRLPAGHAHAAAALTYDYAWRWTLGFELSLSRRTR
jgi:hypothetical protein